MRGAAREYGREVRAGRLTDGLDVPRDLDRGDRAKALEQLDVKRPAYAAIVGVVKDVLPETQVGRLVDAAPHARRCGPSSAGPGEAAIPSHPQKAELTKAHGAYTMTATPPIPGSRPRGWGVRVSTVCVRARTGPDRRGGDHRRPLRNDRVGRRP